MIKRLCGKDLKAGFFKAGVFSFCFVTSLLMFPTPSNSQSEPVGTVEQPFKLPDFPPNLTKDVKNQSINIEICGPALPNPNDQAARQNLKNNFRNAVLAWIEPMRIFGVPLTRTIRVGICGSEPLTTTRRECKFAPDVRRVECEEVEIPVIPDLKAVIETASPPLLPGNRSFYDPPTKTIYLFAGSGYPTILHEVGHAIGLGDSYAEGGFFCDIHHSQFAPASTSVMCNANFFTLQGDDISGAQHIYCTEFPADCRHGVLSVETNKNRPGQDYTDFDLAFANPRICYDRCASEIRCRAYTYVPPGVQGPSPRCWLKDGVPNKTTETGMVSGFKP